MVLACNSCWDSRRNKLLPVQPKNGSDFTMLPPAIVLGTWYRRTVRSQDPPGQHPRQLGLPHAMGSPLPPYVANRRFVCCKRARSFRFCRPPASPMPSRSGSCTHRCRRPRAGRWPPLRRPCARSAPCLVWSTPMYRCKGTGYSTCTLLDPWPAGAGASQGAKTGSWGTHCQAGPVVVFLLGQGRYPSPLLLTPCRRAGRPSWWSMGCSPRHSQCSSSRPFSPLPSPTGLCWCPTCSASISRIPSHRGDRRAAGKAIPGNKTKLQRWVLVPAPSRRVAGAWRQEQGGHASCPAGPSRHSPSST